MSSLAFIAVTCSLERLHVLPALTPASVRSWYSLFRLHYLVFSLSLIGRYMLFLKAFSQVSPALTSVQAGLILFSPDTALTSVQSGFYRRYLFFIIAFLS